MAKTTDQMITIVGDALGKSTNATATSGALLSARCLDFLNWGQQRIARYYSFHELNTYTESAVTVASVKRYPLVTGTNNLGLTRPKDIASIRLIDSQNSRNLIRWHYRKFDRKFPRPENYSGGRPSTYIRWGNDIELFKVPNAVYTLHIRYPQWAPDLTAGSGTSTLENKDQLLITAAILEGYLHFEEFKSAETWFTIFMGRLADAVKVEGDTDWEPEAEPHNMNAGGYTSGEYWIDPYAGAGSPLYGY